MPHAEQRRRVHDVAEEGFRRGIAVENIVLAAFLEIDDELKRETRAVRPFWIGPVAPVSDHVAGIERSRVSQAAHPPRSMRRAARAPSPSCRFCCRAAWRWCRRP